MNEKRQYTDQEKKLSQELLFKTIKLLNRFIFFLIVVSICFLLYDAFKNEVHFSFNQVSKEEINSRMLASDIDDDRIENGIHLATGLVYTDDFELIRGTCTSCHSAQIIIQNRATKEGWTEMIKWMQETQGLWDLGSNEEIIVDYLAEHYSPKDVGRRPNLDMEAIEWYMLKL